MILRLYLRAGGWPGLIFLVLYHYGSIPLLGALFFSLAYALLNLLAARKWGRAKRSDYGLLIYLLVLVAVVAFQPKAAERIFREYFFFGLYSSLFLTVATHLWFDLTVLGSDPVLGRYRLPEVVKPLTILFAGIFLTSAGLSLGEGIMFKLVYPLILIATGYPLARRMQEIPPPEDGPEPANEPETLAIERPEPDLGAILEPARRHTPLPKMGPVRQALVIQGAPAGSVGLTERVLRPLLKGLDRSGVNYRMVRLAERNIVPCQGCFDCWTKTPGSCVLDDDMGPILKKMTETDLVIFALPVHLGGSSSLTRIFLDRCAPLFEPWMVAHPSGRTYRPPRQDRVFGRRMVLVGAASLPAIEIFQPLLAEFEAIALEAESPLVGRLLRPASEILHLGPRLGRRYELVEQAIFRSGLELAKLGQILPETEAAVRSPLFTDEVAFRMVANLFWETCQEYQAAKRAGLELPGVHTFIDQDIRMNLGAMTLSYDPDHDRTDQSIYQFALSGRQPGQWYLQIEDGRCRFQEGWAQDPDLTISAQSQLWVAVVRGDVSVIEALDDGRIKVSGDRELFAAMGATFGWNQGLL